jgi:hypothetical protein
MVVGGTKDSVVAVRTSRENVALLANGMCHSRVSENKRSTPTRSSREGRALRTLQHHM